MEYKYQAIILNKVDVGETDRIYNVYTKESGKIRLLAKGVRKSNAKLAGNLEPVSFAEIFSVKKRGSGKITGVISTDSFLYIKEDIFALEKVFYIFKIFDKLITQEEKDEKLFNLFLSFLSSLDKICSKKQENLKIEILSLGFIFKLLKNLGYELIVKKCAVCSSKLKAGENYFSAERGGVLCKNCARGNARKIKIDDEAIKFMRIFLDNKLENLEKIKAEKKSLNNLKIIANEEIGWITN